MPPTDQGGVVEAGKVFSWRFLTPMFPGSALNPINGSLIATALVPIAAAVDVPVGRTAVPTAASQPGGGSP